ncbi:SDR family oxidoreductase [Nocardia sp. CS682]|uniref:SDR family oxidoreductase n=1 Tax=Nocardia sp. CS682 TaxID=1047172 RepID=UPI001074E61D|nr:SDR family oxidoreductase [Nocardia sp. CS682]QBS38930.1 3-alpha-hydroxysteroid dehydrogenase [Nocardia sp. CS682]
MTERLAGKVALISGGAQGLGAAHARAIVAAGGKVVIGDLKDNEGQALARELGADHARFVHLDVTARAEWDAAVSATIAAFGALNVLVNNAGILLHASIEELTEPEFTRVLAVNLTGTLLGIQASLEELTRAAPSSIINTSSTAGLVGSPGIAAYAASKFGVRGLTKSVAAEMAARGIRANTIHPGLVRTPMIADVPQQVLAPQIGPIGRVAEPAEIAALVVYLASDESAYSTGAEFIADGGVTTIR